jgi:hypothetical protein
VKASLHRAAGLGALAAAGLLLLAAPSPASGVRTLRDASSAVDPTAPLVAVLALLAWALAAWLGLTVLLTLLCRVPGTAGRTAAGVVRRVAPAAVRRLVGAALGVTVVAGALAASPASAAEGTIHAAAAPFASLDWPGSPPPPELDWPLTEPPAPAPEPAAAPTLGASVSTGAAADAVVVQPGDTLWGLAEQAHERRHGATPTDQQTAAAWPSWWAANREAVGDDPDLLLPGTALQPPALDDGAPPA